MGLRGNKEASVGVEGEKLGEYKPLGMRMMESRRWTSMWFFKNAPTVEGLTLLMLLLLGEE